MRAKSSRLKSLVGYAPAQVVERIGKRMDAAKLGESDERRERGEDDDASNPGNEELVDRKGENVERNVQIEDRVGDAEAAGW